MGSFFKGSKGTPGTPGQIVDTTPSEFKGLRSPVADELLRLIQGGGQLGFQNGQITGAGAPIDPNRFAAPITGQEQAFLDTIGQSRGPSSGETASRGLLDQTLSGKFLDPASNPFLAASIEAAQRPLINAFERVALPRLKRGFTAAGQFIQPQSSSPFDKAAAFATGDLIASLGDVSSRIASENFQRERDRQAGAVDQSTRLDTASITNQIAGLQASQLPRLIQQLGLDAGQAEFQRRIALLLDVLNIGGDLASPRGQVSTLQPTQGQKGGASPFSSLLSAAGPILSGLGPAGLAF